MTTERDVLRELINAAYEDETCPIGVAGAEWIKRRQDDATREIKSGTPSLGLATTQQLIEELAARSAVSSSRGEAWTAYRTVDGLPSATKETL